MNRIRFYFASKKVQMAQLHDLSRQLQEAWDEQERLDKAFDWSAVKVAECREERGYLQDQLHRVARERDNERKLRLAAMKDKDYLIDRFHEERDARMSAEVYYEEQLTRAQVRVAAAEDALLDYHLDKREKDEEGRAADRGWLDATDNEEE